MFEKLFLAFAMHSSQVDGLFCSIFNAFFSAVASVVSATLKSGSKTLASYFGCCVNNFSNLSLAHSTQCSVSSGNILSVHCGISVVFSGSAWDP